MKKSGQLLKSKLALSLYPGLFLVAFYCFQLMSLATKVALWEALVALIILLLPFYLNFLLLIPRFLKNKQYFFYLVGVLATVLIAGYLPTLMGPDFYLSNQSFAINISNAVVLVVLSSGYQYAIDYFREQLKQRELERKQMETELQLLRMQLNPHFLFNTLNNLYGLALTKSDRLPGLMLKLSDLLRYLHDEASKDAVTLEEELKFVENYIELQKMRVSKQAQVNYMKQGDATGLTIAPALLINFVENSFKHLNTKDPNAFIDININITNNSLDFRVVNSKAEELPKARSGTGMENIRRRLELLYPGQYDLEVQNEATTFSVNLKIKPS